LYLSLFFLLKECRLKKKPFDVDNETFHTPIAGCDQADIAHKVDMDF